LYGRLNEREMDVTGLLREPGRMDRRSDDFCPACGWPTAEPYEVVSRHITSEGTITWSRCACGRLRVHRGSTLVLRGGALP
jgi:hypothetical protein